MLFNSLWFSRINFHNLSSANEVMGIRIFQGASSLKIIDVRSTTGMAVDDLTKVWKSFRGPLSFCAILIFIICFVTLLWHLAVVSASSIGWQAAPYAY